MDFLAVCFVRAIVVGDASCFGDVYKMASSGDGPLYIGEPLCYCHVTGRSRCMPGKFRSYLEMSKSHRKRHPIESSLATLEGELGGGDVGGGSMGGGPDRWSEARRESEPARAARRVFCKIFPTPTPAPPGGQSSRSRRRTVLGRRGYGWSEGGEPGIFFDIFGHFSKNRAKLREGEFCRSHCRPPGTPRDGGLAGGSPVRGRRGRG